jgi:trimethylamine--corrinoid protein Co-methyltransferase
MQMTDILEKKPQRRGREAKRASRTSSLAHDANIVSPSMKGGTYKPLTTEEADRICETALDILEQHGMAQATDTMRDLFLANGAIENGDRICFPRKMVETAMATACREFSVTGLDGQRTLTFGGSRVNFGGNSYTVHVRDLETQEYRKPSIIDLYDLTRLEDKLDNLHYVRIPTIAQDLSPEEFDLNSAYAVATATGKPFSLAISFEQYVDPVVELFDMMAGGPGEFAKRPFCIPICVHVVPPLKWAQDSCLVIEKLVKAGFPVIMHSAGMLGATSPASVAGMLAQTVAEAFAGLVWVNLMKPGHPMLFGVSPLGCDMRSGSCVMGSAEHALLEAAAAQLCAHLGLPGAQLSGTTDSKTLDFQSGAEKSYNALTIALAGGGHIGIAAGGHAANMGMIPESLVLDNDNLGNVLRILKGVEVTEESLSMNTIGDVINGEGHFLGHSDTMRLMSSEYYYPEFADRDAIDVWEEKNKPDPVDLARARAVSILDEHYPEYITPETDVAIRKRFNIKLPRECMAPSSRRPLTTNKK